jgi:hypothetical protein
MRIVSQLWIPYHIYIKHNHQIELLGSKTRYASASSQSRVNGVLTESQFGLQPEQQYIPRYGQIFWYYTYNH